MSATSSYLEQAYEKMFRWCCFEFRQMGRDAQLEVSSSMREAVRRLRQRPELLAYVRRVVISVQISDAAAVARRSPTFRKLDNPPFWPPSLTRSLAAALAASRAQSSCTRTTRYGMSATCLRGCTRRSPRSASSLRAFSVSVETGGWSGASGHLTAAPRRSGWAN